jgi:hypothetical protein
MEIGENVSRIKDNLLLIPSERFDTLTKDPGYKTSFIYLIACLILSIPIMLIGAMAQGIGIIAAIISLPISLILSIPILYIMYLIQFALLKIVGGKASFQQSVQIFIYGGTAALIFGNFPFLGMIAGLIALANIVLGSARIHQISTLRSIIALIIIPLIILIILGLIIFMVLGAFFYSIFGGTMLV